jgi:hypothetical protein
VRKGGTCPDSGDGRPAPALERSARVGNARHGHAAQPVRGRGAGWVSSGPPATVSGGAGQNGLNGFKFQTVQKCSNFLKAYQSKFDLSELQKFEIKYGF